MERPSAFEIVNSRDELKNILEKIRELTHRKDPKQYVEIKEEAYKFIRIAEKIDKAMTLFDEWLKER